MANILTTRLDPVDGLVDYTLFVKPYHTKILEVLVEYIHTDCIDVTFEEGFYLSLGMPDPSLLSLWGWTLEEAKKFFNCDFQAYQVCTINSVGNYFEVVGDYTARFNVGDKILVRTDQLQFAEFTISGITSNTNSLTTRVTTCTATGSPPPGCATLDVVDCPYLGSPPITAPMGSPIGSPILPGTQGSVLTCYEPKQTTTDLIKTRLDVVETVPVVLNEKTAGVIYPASCWTYNAASNVYEFNGGISWPSNVSVERNIDCGGFGTIFEQAVGSPPILPDNLGTPTNVVGVNAASHYFEIQNNSGVPPAIGSWKDLFTPGVKFQVTGSTDNDSVYTVLVSHLVYSGSPPALTSPEILRIYVTGNIVSDIADGQLGAIPWGYDEPTLCVDQGESMIAESAISENMQMTLNDNGASIVAGWDMQQWDIAGFDGGSFTYTITFT